VSGPSSAPFRDLAPEIWEMVNRQWLSGAEACIAKRGKLFHLNKLFGKWPGFGKKKAAWTALTAAVLAERIRRERPASGVTSVVVRPTVIASFGKDQGR
jgi:hypothetical protein